MRDIDTIDGELRLLARARRVARELCDRTPTTGAHRRAAGQALGRASDDRVN